MRLHRKRIRAKCGSVTDIRNSVEPLPGHTQLCHIHTMRWQQFTIRSQVDCGNRERGSNPASMGRRRIDKESVPQQRSGGANLPLRQQLSDPAARTNESSHLASIVDHYLKTKLPAQLVQFSHAAFRAIAKAKVETLMHLDRPQRIMNNRSDKLRSPHTGKFRGKGKHQNRIDPGISQQLQFRLQRRNQLGTSLRAQKTQRMWIERNRNRPQRSRRGALPELLQNELVPNMDAIEVADAHDRGSQAAGYLAGIAKNLHVYISNGIRNPS